MSAEEAAIKTAVKVGMGAVGGIVTGMKAMPAPHAAHAAVANLSANFFNGATKALKTHKGVSGAVAAGAAAVAGSSAVAAAAVVAAPYVAATAVVGGAAYGVYKLVGFLRDL